MTYFAFQNFLKMSPWNVVPKVLDYNIAVSKFELQSRDYVDFRTYSLGIVKNTLIPTFSHS